MTRRVARRATESVTAEVTGHDVEVERVEPHAPAREGIAVGSVHDPAEADADHLAAQALAIADDYASDTAGRSPAQAEVHRSPTADVDGLSVDPSALARARSGGASLDGAARAKLEQGFGTDLGGVRIHTGGAAADVARQIHARAFTHGSDIYFGEGEYRPGTPDGDRVIAHEVAHTVQAGAAGGVQRFPATWSTSPVPWKPMTSSVFRPGEGASGGVYILTAKDGTGPVQKAVVKPVFGTNGLGFRESGQQLQFSDAALGKLLGLSSPTSKVVYKGTEFDHLVDLCKSKQPAPSPGEESASLADAESFVVMSEVPNAASVGSMAERAGSDKRVSADLFRTVFDHTFLAELGQLCVGDLMVGNPDRMVLGAMNLGNIMVSMQQDGRGKLAAIDTTAYLPKVVPPEEWVQRGGQGGGFANMKSDTNDPGALLDGFFEILVNRIKSHTPADAGDHPTWAVLEATYKNNRDYYFASFDFGWNDALITAMSLADDRQRAKDATAGYDDQDITSDTLLANLNYLGSRAEGKSHDESVGRSIAITAGAWVKSLDLARITPPAADELSAKVVGAPVGKVQTAEVATMPSLPTGANLSYLSQAGNRPLPQRDYATLPKYPPAIKHASAEVDAEVSATKKRRKKPFGKKEEVPRNRSVISHYVVHSVAMGAGAGRIADAAMTVESIARQAAPLLSADYRDNEAAPVKSLLTQLGTSVPVLGTHLSVYKRQVAASLSTIPGTRYGDRDALTASLKKIDTYLDNAVAALATVKNQNLQRSAAGIRSRPR